MIGLSGDFNTLGRDVSDDPDRNAWTWERVTHDQFFRNS